MSHFKYEIDERNIRLQLKEMEMPFSEEAWQKFENYSSSHTSSVGETSVKRFQFSLNRNVILPTVFGAIIVSFSLLLFNFVNIKNPNSVREARAETSPQSFANEPAAIQKNQPTPAVKAAEPAGIVQQPALQPPAPVEKAQETQPGGNQEKAVAEEPGQEKEIPSASIRITKSKDTVTETTEAPAVKTEAPPAKPEVRAKKRNKKRSAVITEPVAGEDEQAPPPAEEPAAE